MSTRSCTLLSCDHARDFLALAAARLGARVTDAPRARRVSCRIVWCLLVARSFLDRKKSKKNQKNPSDPPFDSENSNRPLALHLRYIVDSLISLTRWLVIKIGSRVFFPLWRPVRTASALSGSLIRCSAPKMEDDIVRSAQWCWRVCVARDDVAPELRFQRRVDGLLTRKTMVLS